MGEESYDDLFGGPDDLPWHWRLEQALALIRDLQPRLHEKRWHVTFGGSVLNNGSSGKDLDLFFFPFGMVGANGEPVEDILPMLTEMWGEPYRLNQHEDNYPPNLNFGRSCKFYPVGRGRIDAFIGRYYGDGDELTEVHRVMTRLKGEAA